MKQFPGTVITTRSLLNLKKQNQQQFPHVPSIIMLKTESSVGDQACDTFLWDNKLQLSIILRNPTVRKRKFQVNFC